MKNLIKKVTPEFLKQKYRNYLKNKELRPYIGDKVLCPICNSKFKEFLPFGLIARKNARCPTCGALERHRLLYKYLNEKTDIFNSDRTLRLLHFAPEKVFYDIFSRNQKIEYTPADFYPEACNYNGTAEIKKIDITSIPFIENYFDVVLCSHVLEHIPNDRLAMSEIHRVMKKGAWAILQVPIDYNREHTYEDFSITTPEARELAFGQNDHVRWYGRDYKDRLAETGFTVIEDDYVKTFSSEDLFRYGLVASELIYYCTKE